MNILFVLLSLFASGAGTAWAEASTADKAQAVVNCLLTADYVRDDLKELGLPTGTKTAVRFHQGSVPGMSRTPTEIQIVVYSTDRRRGWLLFAEPNTGGGYKAIRNGYRLHKTSNGWSADEGNGGLATYRAMSRFASQLARTPDYVVELKAGGAGCSHD